jgi:hypothetical protein
LVIGTPAGEEFRKPIATQLVAEAQAMSLRPAVVETGAPGVPSVIGTTTLSAPIELLMAKHWVSVAQATFVKEDTPGTPSGVPGVPFVMGTTTASLVPLTFPIPTAMQDVALGQAMSES